MNLSDHKPIRSKRQKRIHESEMFTLALLFASIILMIVIHVTEE